MWSTTAKSRSSGHRLGLGLNCLSTLNQYQVLHGTQFMLETSHTLRLGWIKWSWHLLLLQMKGSRKWLVMGVSWDACGCMQQTRSLALPWAVSCQSCRGRCDGSINRQRRSGCTTGRLWTEIWLSSTAGGRPFHCHEPQILIETSRSRQLFCIMLTFWNETAVVVLMILRRNRYITLRINTCAIEACCFIISLYRGHLSPLELTNIELRIFTLDYWKYHHLLQALILKNFILLCMWTCATHMFVYKSNK